MTGDIAIKDITNTPLSEVYWRDYLASKGMDIPDFDKDQRGNLSEKGINHLREFSKGKIDGMCERCISKQIRDHGEIVIKCRGLATVENSIPEEIRHKFSESEMEVFKEIVDPYHWADKYIDPHTPTAKRMFNPRWYQEQMVKCTANRKVYRCGRRTGKTYSFALNILHRVLTNKDYKVLIVTPFEVQAEELINQIREFTYRLDENYGTYKELIIKDVKSPNYLMQFQNRSRIRGFTTGSSGAGSVRGQSADLIVLDEVDFMSDKDFNAILAILADNPETELWVASTPDGKKALYRLEKIREMKKFHYPTFVLPHYTDSLDRDFKNQLDDVGYIQEIMAEFGASKAGVFQNYFIDKSVQDGMSQAQRDDVLKNRNNYVCILGCDWNDDRVGTRLMVVAFDKLNKKFFIAEKKSVNKDGWTQVQAVEEIVQLNRKYKFEHMYLDEGFGTSQIQFIKKFAIDQYGKLPEDHPDLNLANVVGINFSSKIDVRDVETGQELKKDMKTYLVENSVRYLERDQLMFDADYDKDLMNQMSNYIVKGRSPSGKPNFAAEDEKIGDHDLDAFMLALLGFSMEYSEFLNMQTSDVIVKLVSRDEIKNAGSENKVPGFNDDPSPDKDFEYIGSLERTASRLYKRHVGGYNRSSFSSQPLRSHNPVMVTGEGGMARVDRANSARWGSSRGRRSSF